jgi:hypothetical protein
VRRCHHAPCCVLTASLPPCSCRMPACARPCARMPCATLGA